jgi:archaeosine synthase
VTGEWDEEEATMIRTQLSHLLTLRKYARVVSHLPTHTYELVKDILPSDTIVTCEVENATNPDALKRLELSLRELTKQHGRARLEQIQLERLRSLSDYQFGPPVTDRLFAGAHVTGKWPTGIVRQGATQLAMLPTERGLLSLTLPGAQRLLDAGSYAVEIEDFPVKGSVFAVGVRTADPQIRPGDEVVLHHAGQVRAVGVAQMSGLEMTQIRKGEAVKVRHHA